jgi:phage terminase small subunit
MTRGRKPKPTHLKLIEGNPGKRPIRTGSERPTTAMPEPPDHLNADARIEWDRVAHGLHALRLLETVDRVLHRLCPLGAGRTGDRRDGRARRAAVRARRRAATTRWAT